MMIGILDCQGSIKNTPDPDRSPQHFVQDPLYDASWAPDHAFVAHHLPIANPGLWGTLDMKGTQKRHFKTYCPAQSVPRFTTYCSALLTRDTRILLC